MDELSSHNPYFNRWFSAISKETYGIYAIYRVTILILIDGFLQLKKAWQVNPDGGVTILILIDGFLQYKAALLNLVDEMVTILILIDGFLQ